MCSYPGSSLGMELLARCYLPVMPAHNTPPRPKLPFAEHAGGLSPPDFDFALYPDMCLQGGNCRRVQEERAACGTGTGVCSASVFNAQYFSKKRLSPQLFLSLRTPPAACTAVPGYPGICFHGGCWRRRRKSRQEMERVTWGPLISKLTKYFQLWRCKLGRTKHLART
eukprot:709020-Rhodomonas_salina.2